MQPGCLPCAAENHVWHDFQHSYPPQRFLNFSTRMDLIHHLHTVDTVSGKGDEILQNAIDSFRTIRTPEQLVEFNTIQSVLDTDAVMVLTAELDFRR
jgi:hypothetical protein